MDYHVVASRLSLLAIVILAYHAIFTFLTDHRFELFSVLLTLVMAGVFYLTSRRVESGKGDI